MHLRNQQFLELPSADAARARLAQLRVELVLVERLARVLAVDASSAMAAVDRERRDAIEAADPCGLWWLASTNSQPRMLTIVPRLDEARLARKRIGLAEVEAEATIARELAAVAAARMAALRERALAAEAHGQVGATPSTGTLADACAPDTRQLALAVRASLDSADVAAAHAVNDEIRAVLDGRDDVRTSSLRRALAALARAHLHLELLSANMIAIRGRDDLRVARIGLFVRELPIRAELADQAWLDRVASFRAIVLAVIDQLFD